MSGEHIIQELDLPGAWGGDLRVSGLGAEIWRMRRQTQANSRKGVPGRGSRRIAEHPETWRSLRK